jgi:hypothetical protein
MATAARTTGAEAQTEELRRRNVASQSSAAAPVEAQAPPKEKSKEKVCLDYTSGGDAFGQRLVGQLRNNGTMG